MGAEDRPSLPSLAVESGLALIPGIGGALSVIWRAAQERDRQRVAQLGEDVRREVDDDTLLIDRLRHDERLADVFIEAAEAARRTALEYKRQTMACVVAQAVTDEALVDESAALVSTLAAFEAPHFKLLADLRHDPPQLAPFAEADIPEPYRSQLIAHGVVSLVSSGGALDAGQVRIGPLTPFGHRVLEWIESTDYGGSDTPSSEDCANRPD